METLEFTSLIYEGKRGGAFVKVPVDIKSKYNKGRLKVDATFDGIPYTGSVVNMGVKNEDGSICYILGMLKDIRTTLNKNIGDEVFVTISAIQ